PGRRGLVHRPAPGRAGPAGPGHRQGRAHRAGRGLAPARRDHRAGQGPVDHRRRAQRDRARGSGHARGHALSAAHRRVHQPEHRHVRWRRRAVVHRAGRLPRAGRPEERQGRGVGFAARAGPYGITTTPTGDVYYASLAGSHIARIDTKTGVATPIDPPTPNQGARRVWSDSKGRIWVSEWNAGQVSVYEPGKGWQSWKLPGEHPRAYSVWVDEHDKVWLTDFSANAIVRFDPATETFDSFPGNRANAAVRQMLGRAGEAWGAESGTG